MPGSCMRARRCNVLSSAHLLAVPGLQPGLHNWQTFNFICSAVMILRLCRRLVGLTNLLGLTGISPI